MKSITRHPILKAIVADLFIYGFFCGLLWWLGPYNFTYLEQLGTYYYDWYGVVRDLTEPGAICQMAAQFLIQFFITPTAAVLITALLLSLITVLGARILRFMSGTLAYTPLALLPAIAIAFLHYNINYMYSGSIAFLLLLLALNILIGRNYQLSIKSFTLRIFYVVIATFFLYAAAGAVAFIFGLMLFIGALFRKPKQAIYYLICPVLTLLQAWLSVRSGMVCDLKHALLPDSYFNHILPAPSLVYMPYVMVIVAYVLCCVLCYVNNYRKGLKNAFFVVLLIGAVAFAVMGGRNYINPQTELFKKYNYLLRAQQWDDIINDYATKEWPNLMIQNCVNMAMAENGVLADSLFNQPCIDIRNIYITGDSRPYLNMLLSDIYYSMGHIALAQRHAFEANESLSNMSPRLLQRLVQTNIIFGNYKTAEKYLGRLDRTLFYRDWATKYRKLLSDEAVMADAEMSAKRACVFDDNRFSGIYGLDDDLKEILRANPEHQVTLQYLTSLYLLSKDEPRMLKAVDEFYVPGTELPVSCQQAILGAYAADADSIVERYRISPEVIEQYEAYKAHPMQNTKNYWFFKRYVE